MPETRNNIEVSHNKVIGTVDPDTGQLLTSRSIQSVMLAPKVAPEARGKSLIGRQLDFWGGVASKLNPVPYIKSGGAVLAKVGAGVTTVTKYLMVIAIALAVVFLTPRLLALQA